MAHSHTLTYHTLWGYLQCGQSTSSNIARLQLHTTSKWRHISRLRN